MSDLLDRIVARTRQDLAARKERALPLERRRRPPVGLISALVAVAGAEKVPPAGVLPPSPSSGAPGASGLPPSGRAAVLPPGDRINLIAEIKPRSPSKGELRKTADLAPIIDAYRARAQAISVLIDGPFFGGGLDLLARMREAFFQPILAKGFFVDPYQIDEAFAAGADAILLIVRLLDDPTLSALLAHAHSFGLDALVEVHSDTELERAVAVGARIVGVNARDLDTLTIDLGAARGRLDRIPKGIVRVAESGLEHRASIDALRGLAHAALVGSAFMDKADPIDAMRALGW